MQPVAAKLRVPDLRALPRQRVLAALRHGVRAPLTLLVAPPGAGKTTAVAAFVRSSGLAHTWYRAEATESDAAALLGHLEHALAGVVPEVARDWSDVATAARALSGVARDEPTVLVIDDLHELHGSPAETVVEQVLAYLPPWLRVIAMSRHLPGFDLTRLRVSGEVAEIPADVLRWRTWEVERLFRDFYREPLRPEDAARLTHRTEGWAAGLQLFHLASRQLPIAGRTRLIDDLHTRPGLVRDYLTRNVLRRLPDELRDFLLDTCVLGRLLPALCDELRERDDSAAFLGELEDRQLFTLPCEDGRGYRYHEVLRTYLDASLLARDGAAATRARYHRAAGLLEQAGAPAEALQAFARAEAWSEVTRLLGRDGATLASGGALRTLEQLPPGLVDTDPWLLLARARAFVGDGRLREADVAYRAAAEAFGSAPGARVCQDELAAVRPWLETHETPVVGLTDLLRAALRRDPLARAEEAAGRGGSAGQVVAAVAALLAGAANTARRHARRATAESDADVLAFVGGRMLEHLADLIGGRTTDPDDLLAVSATAEQLGATWLARVVRVVAWAETGGPQDEPERMRVLLDEHGDEWGAGAVELVDGIAAALRPPRAGQEPGADGDADPATPVDGAALLARAAERFHRLDAPVLSAWALAFRSVAVASTDPASASEIANLARQRARAAVVPGAEAVADLVRAGVASRDDPPGGRALASARSLGLALPVLARDRASDEPTPRPTERAPASTVRCFGGLRLVLNGREVDLAGLKPQAREALSLLALEAGTAVHRERLIAALWPTDDLAAAARRLQVLVSTLRRDLEPEVPAAGRTLVVRRGEAYVLDPPVGACVDVRAFDDAVAAAHGARVAGDAAGEERCLEDAFSRYTGDLLPELGPTDWVVAERERLRTVFAEVTRSLAQRRLAGGDAGAAVEICTAGLRADRFRSALWGLLAQAHRAAGDPAAAARTDSEHLAVLAELQPSTQITDGAAR